VPRAGPAKEIRTQRSWAAASRDRGAVMSRDLDSRRVSDPLTGGYDTTRDRSPMSGDQASKGQAMTDTHTAGPFLVTGATGKTGAHTVALLREHGLPVRALVRGHDDRSERLRGLGAETVAVDLLDYAAVRAAATDTTAAYFAYPPGPGYVEAAANFAQAAADARVRAVVELSQIGVRPDTTHIGQQHWVVERLFDRGPYLTTHLRPTLFMDWVHNFWIRIGEREGILRLPMADVPVALITTADQAKVIVSILRDPDRHDRRIYELFGAEELDWHAIAARVAQALGIAVRYEPVDIEAMTTALTAAGVPDDRVQHLGRVVRDCRDGFYSGFNDLVATLSGSTPTTVADYVRAHAESFDRDGVLAITDTRLACWAPPGLRAHRGPRPVPSNSAPSGELRRADAASGEGSVTHEHARGPLRPDALIGTWRLVSYTARQGPTGETTYPLGSDAAGFLVYTADGYMSVQMMRRRRPDYDQPDVLGATDDQYARAAEGYVAYGGPYSIDADGTVSHVVDVSLLPNWLHSVQLRQPTLRGDQLTMHAEYDVGPVHVSSVLTWKRAPEWPALHDH
jgi:NAD(P)H dehydrogenase (quinone)